MVMLLTLADNLEDFHQQDVVRGIVSQMGSGCGAFNSMCLYTRSWKKVKLIAAEVTYECVAARPPASQPALPLASLPLRPHAQFRVHFCFYLTPGWRFFCFCIYIS